MKKEYINPEMEVVMLQTNATILAGSEGGTQTGDTPGKEYNPDDVSYSSGFFDNGGQVIWRIVCERIDLR